MNGAHELAALYVVDALTPDETLEFEMHLASCAACQEEVADMRSVTEHLSRSFETEPPATLRASVLAGIARTAQQPAAPTRPDNVVSLQERTRRRLPYLVAAASVLLALGFGGWGLQSRDDAQQASQQQAQILQLLAAPDVHTVSGSAAGGASGTVVVSRAISRALFVAKGMPKLPDHQVYELWTIKQKPVPAGTFTPSGSTSLITLPTAALSARTIAVTVEPQGGSVEPTSDPIMALTLT
jgi:anti-sigma-K factor RskA